MVVVLDMVVAGDADGRYMAASTQNSEPFPDECDSSSAWNDPHDEFMSETHSPCSTRPRLHHNNKEKQQEEEEKKKREEEEEATYLRRLSQIPNHLQFNKYVTGHYRPPLDFAGCLKSLTYFHNETINVITHGVPVLMVVCWLPWMLPWSQLKDVPWLPTTHALSCLSPWVGSTIYHLFMCHQGGSTTYRFLLKLDLLGIWVTQSLGGLVTICASIHCIDGALQSKILLVYLGICVFCLYQAMTVKTVWGRRFAFISPFSVRVAAFLLRCSSLGGGHPDSVYYIVMQDLLACVGAYIGAVNIPEKWFPGRLDLLFNSHHIMHILVLLAVYHMHQAAYMDLTWMTHQDPCGSPINADLLTTI